MDSGHQEKHDQQFMRLEDQDPMGSHSNKTEEDNFKRKREIFARNTLISLFSLGGFIGAASLTAIIIGIILRQPKRYCRKSFLTPNQDYCSRLIPNESAPDDTDIVLILEGILLLVLTVIGIIGARKEKRAVTITVSVGYGVCVIIQMSVCGVALERHDNTNYDSPYVPTLVRNQVHDSLFASLRKFPTSTSDQAVWQALADELCCCGVHDYEDFVTWTSDVYVPDFCLCVCEHFRNGECNYYKCPGRTYGSCTRADRGVNNTAPVVQSGCLQPLVNKIGRHRKSIMLGVYSITLVFGILLIFPALASVFALCCRCCCTRVSQPGVLYQPGQQNQPVMIMVPMQGHTNLVS